jgi:hypothetical protein
MRATIMWAGLAALTLAGCNPPGDTAKDATDAATDAATTRSDPVGLPEGPKPGLWRVTTRFAGLPAGAPTPVTETCIREARFERPDATMADTKGMDCQQEAFRREGDAIVGRSVCTMGEGLRSESNFRITGDLTQRYTMEVRSSITPAPTPETASTTMVLTAERLGDCPAPAQ